MPSMTSLPLGSTYAYMPVMRWRTLHAHYRLGASLIGMIVNSVLLGITYTQTFHYYTSRFWSRALREDHGINIEPIPADYSKDSCRLKLLVREHRHLRSVVVSHHHLSFILGGLHRSVKHSSPNNTLVLRWFQWMTHSRRMADQFPAYYYLITNHKCGPSVSMRLYKVSYKYFTAILPPSTFWPGEWLILMRFTPAQIVLGRHRWAIRYWKQWVITYRCYEPGTSSHYHTWIALHPAPVYHDQFWNLCRLLLFFWCNGASSSATTRIPKHHRLMFQLASTPCGYGPVSGFVRSRTLSSKQVMIVSKNYLLIGCILLIVVVNAGERAHAKAAL